ncbi:PDZ domain-containing protein, partial [Candidatus Pelagibacter bacterium]|nr:PDZ domain-containing protein [Candidatus Pelagibacter bacterium]
ISGRSKSLIKANYFSKEITDRYLFNGSKNETLIVTCLRKGSQAEKSGIRFYDEIIEVDGKSIKDLPNFNFDSKRNINIKIVRNSKTLNIKTTNEHYNELDKLSLSCVNEYKEYECADIIQIDYDRRKNDYFDNLHSCIEEKNILTIPFGPIPDEYNWIKVDTVTNVVKQYANKETRNLEKLDFYLPIASEVLKELDLYITKNDEDKIALQKYKNLRKSVTYANRYALVKGLKNSTVFEMNDGTISGYKKAITFLINKNQKISHLDRDIFDESFQALFEYGEKKFIYENWPKAIKLIDWQSLSLAEIKTFRMFYQLGDLHSTEPNYQEAIKYYEMGIKKLDQWAKDLPPNRLYVVYKRRMHVKKSFQKSSFATVQYNKTFDNKYLKIIDEDIEDSKNLIEYFYSLPAEIKKEIRVKNPKHLSEIYNVMVTSYGFKQNPKKGYEFALKGLREIEKYSLGTNRNKDLYGAYHMTILYSIGSNQLNDAVYYINQSKNIATQLLKEFDGEWEVAYLSSIQLPFFINAGLYAEAEDLINFIYSTVEFDNSTAMGRVQSDIFNYSLGRINLIKKDYTAAIYDLELAKQNYLEKPGPGIYNMYSAFANLLLLEAFIEEKMFGNFEKQFELLTGVKPTDYKSLKSQNDLVGTLVANHHYIPSDIDISVLASLLKYLDAKKIKISKKDSKEFFDYINGFFEDYTPGEESRLEMIRNSVKASSLLASVDLKESTKFLSKMVNEVKNEYTSELYDSNLTPIHKIDDIIEGYLNASFISNDKKFFNNSYKVIQVVSNSITAKDIKKSLKTKKFQDPEANELIAKYQALQIEKVSFTSGKEFNLSSVLETTLQDREKFDVTRSIK